MPESTSSTTADKKRLLVPLLILSGIVLSLVIAALVVALAVRPSLFPPSTGSIPLEITRISSTSPLPHPSPPPPPIVEVGDAPVPLAIPVTLDLGGSSFSIQPSEPNGTEQLSPPSAAGTATWMYGTVINYIFILQGTPENKTLVEQLGADDSIMVSLSNGTRLTFGVTGQQEIQPEDRTLLVQSRPGLTVMVPGDETELVVLASFETAEEPTPPPGASVVAVGQPAQVGDVRVTVEDGYAERDVAGLAAGTMAYLVEFSVENTGPTPLDTDTFVTELVDGVGNQYLPSPTIARQGTYGPLSGEMAPGGVARGTAGYLVPDTMVGPELTWIFGPRPSSELRVRFAISYNPPLTATILPDVGVAEAFLGENGNVLHVVGYVDNLGTTTLTVDEGDVMLSSSAGEGTLLSVAPPLPWVIEAWDSREIELQFERPDASSAIVTILGYTFEISGLP